MRMRKSSLIWFVGAGVWLFDAVIALHYGHSAQALLGLVVACVFFAAGIMWSKSSERRR